MPFREVSKMESRFEFVRLSRTEGVNFSALCQRYGISRQTGYKWLHRFEADSGLGIEGLSDKSRRPLHSPQQISTELEQSIIAVRRAHKAWGARKIWHVLNDQGLRPPAPSTIHKVLVRNALIGTTSGSGTAFTRFEKDEPNALWQMDFKGQFHLEDHAICYPLTVVDDHSRFSLCIGAKDNQRTQTVKSLLENTFYQYGLPNAFYVDNGSPWGGGVPGQWTPLRVWLLKLGVDLIHARPFHPQGRGKNERFHRTMKAEAITGKILRNLGHAQRAFDEWRHVYNHLRPHEALGQKPPITRYRPSKKSMPLKLPIIEYESHEIIRKVRNDQPFISFKGRNFKLPKAFRGEVVALRQCSESAYNVCFGANIITKLDFKNEKIS